MFTGIITDIGTVQAIEQRGDTRFVIATAFDTATIDIGASISCGGACMTVVEKSLGLFSVDVSAESLSRTTLKDWQVGTRLNLERSLKVGDELGGHWVTGHVDGVGHVAAAHTEGDSLRLAITLPLDLLAFMAEKGSVTVDGVSLTVNNVSHKNIYLNIIPHTQQWTTLGGLKVGDLVNIEVDTIARYIKRLLPHLHTTNSFAPDGGFDIV